LSRRAGDWRARIRVLENNKVEEESWRMMRLQEVEWWRIIRVRWRVEEWRG
jgi:hypothetical protein